MQPDQSSLLEIVGITTPLIGFYDVPDTKPFEPFAKAKHCIFPCYENWLKGESLCISKETFSCMGAGYWLCGVESISREKFVRFLAEAEGLKSSPALMNQWLDHYHPYKQENPYIVIGPLRKEQYAYLKTITFYVNPDQLSVLMIGTQYHGAPSDPKPVLAPFGSGCSQLAALFENFDLPQAIIGTTDIAMRQYLPPDILALTVTRSMFKQLCELDENSFLYKPFWKSLRKARGHIKKP